MCLAAGRPHDVTVLEKTASTIRLQWIYDQVGATFWVWYRPITAADAADADVKWIESEQTSNKDYTLTDLLPATVYKLRIVAQNEAGDTQHSDEISCQTDEQSLTLGTGSQFVWQQWMRSCALCARFHCNLSNLDQFQ